MTSVGSLYHFVWNLKTSQELISQELIHVWISISIRLDFEKVDPKPRQRNQWSRRGVKTRLVLGAQRYLCIALGALGEFNSFLVEMRSEEDHEVCLVCFLAVVLER